MWMRGSGGRACDLGYERQGEYGDRGGGGGGRVTWGM